MIAFRITRSGWLIRTLWQTGGGLSRRAKILRGHRFSACVDAASLAHSRGLGINAGHDLDNLTIFATLPHLYEVSIGPALIGKSLFDELGPVVRAYVALLERD
jgi:pyridoxine 5'-phosphate synthase PdxJ